MGLSKSSAIVAYLPLIAIIAIAAVDSHARELRPSDHGLGHQQQSPAPDPSKTKSFFEASSPPDDVELPKAVNSSSDNAGWWQRGGGDVEYHAIRHVLLVVGLVCGVSGVALLVASAVVYLFRYKKRNSEAQSPMNNAVK